MELRDELHVHVQRQVRHVKEAFGYVPKVHARLRHLGAVRLYDARCQALGHSVISLAELSMSIRPNRGSC